MTFNDLWGHTSFYNNVLLHNVSHIFFVRCRRTYIFNKEKNYNSLTHTLCLKFSFPGDGLKKIKNPLNVIAINASAYLFKKYDDFLSDFSHGLLDHRVTMAKKVSQMFASMKLRHDSIQENATKNTKYIRRTSVKNVLLQSQ